MNSFSSTWNERPVIFYGVSVYCQTKNVLSKLELLFSSTLLVSPEFAKKLINLFSF